MRISDWSSDVCSSDLHRIQIKPDLAQLHAVPGERAALGLLEQLGRTKQRLGRDASHVQAGAAQRRPAFRTGRLQPELSRTNGGDIAARTSADYQNVEIVISHMAPSAR